MIFHSGNIHGFLRRLLINRSRLISVSACLLRGYFAEYNETGDETPRADEIEIGKRVRGINEMRRVGIENISVFRGVAINCGSGINAEARAVKIEKEITLSKQSLTVLKKEAGVSFGRNMMIYGVSWIRFR